MDGKRNLHFGIHQSRRHLKILRAALRLIRFDLTPKTFKDENKFYRDIARQLSDARDFTAFVETIDGLNSGTRIKFKSLVSTLHHKILAERKLFISLNRDKIDAAAVSLKEHQQIAAEINWTSAYRENLLKGISYTYHLAYMSHQKSKLNASDENIHEYRKTTKYLRYQVLFLREVWPTVFIALEHELHLLSDLLGKANNLTLLQNYLSHTDLISLKKGKEFNAYLQKQKERLINKGIALGTKLFAEKTKAFEQRLEVYLDQWKTLSENPQRDAV